MLTKLIIENFKKFEKVEIDLSRQTLLFVGQNNGGKTTALQALGLWGFLTQQWKSKKGESQAKKRTGASITRREFHVVPIRDLRSLWTNCEVQDKDSKKINIRIMVEGVNQDDEKWSHGIEITYGSPEVVYCRPIGEIENFPEDINRVVYLPPLSGVQTSEKQLPIGAQLHAVGEGRPGEILRTLLVELYEKHQKKWKDLQKELKELFQVQLDAVDYNPNTDADIALYFRHILPDGSNKGPRLEISNGGSGFLQFLLLASFLSVRSESVLLVDEPDSHMHVFLQREMYKWLEKTAGQNNCKLIISTHSEVLVNSTDIQQITTFFGKRPKPLNLKRNLLNVALDKVSPLQILNMEWKKRVVFVEGESDRRILEAWAETLQHPVISKLKNAYYEFLRTNKITEAIKLYETFVEVIPESLQAFCLRDHVGSATQNVPSGFKVYGWKEKEIENYLIHPKSLIRFAEYKSAGSLFKNAEGKKAEKYLKENLSPKFYDNPLGVSLAEKGSDFLEKFFSDIGQSIGKVDYYEIAQTMKPDEISDEVKTFLNTLDKFLGS